MWLLSTSRAELHYFTSPEHVNEKSVYATLSHTWGENEQTFQNTVKYDPNRITEDSPRDYAMLELVHS